MARAETKYYCEICNTEFFNEELANACENVHLKAVKITAETFEKNDKRYPNSLNIKFVSKADKESTITYYRKG